MKAAETSWLTVFETYDNKVEVNQGGAGETRSVHGLSFVLLPSIPRLTAHLHLPRHSLPLNGTFAPVRRYKLDLGAAPSELRLHDSKIQGRKTAVNLSTLSQTSFDSHFTHGISVHRVLKIKRI